MRQTESVQTMLEYISGTKQESVQTSRLDTFLFMYRKVSKQQNYMKPTKIKSHFTVKLSNLITITAIFYFEYFFSFALYTRLYCRGAIAPRAPALVGPHRCPSGVKKNNVMTQSITVHDWRMCVICLTSVCTTNCILQFEYLV